MNANSNEKLPVTGIVSADGFFSDQNSLNTVNREYAGYSVPELKALLTKNEVLEYYEKCAVIRDEIYRRA